MERYKKKMQSMFANRVHVSFAILGSLLILFIVWPLRLVGPGLESSDWVGGIATIEIVLPE